MTQTEILELLDLFRKFANNTNTHFITSKNALDSLSFFREKGKEIESHFLGIVKDMLAYEPSEDEKLIDRLIEKFLIVESGKIPKNGSKMTLWKQKKHIQVHEIKEKQYKGWESFEEHQKFSGYGFDEFLKEQEEIESWNKCDCGNQQTKAVWGFNYSKGACDGCIESVKAHVELKDEVIEIEKYMLILRKAIKWAQQ